MQLKSHQQMSNLCAHSSRALQLAAFRVLKRKSLVQHLLPTACEITEEENHDSERGTGQYTGKPSL